MYEKHWSLQDKPFRNTPDPKYFYFAPQYEEALSRALYVITEGQGAMLLTGDCGCGKTLLIRVLIDELDPDRFEVALIQNPNMSPRELLQEILRQFGFDAAGWDKSKMYETLAGFLAATHKRGASTIVIVDEAQVVQDDETLEEIRLLLNFQQDKSFYLSLILAGQPELRGRVDALPQLSQRLSVKYHIAGLIPDDSRKYLHHRLSVAGSQTYMFSDEAEKLLIDCAQGVPRRLNLLADFSLLAGYGNSKNIVDADIVKMVIQDRYAEI